MLSIHTLTLTGQDAVQSKVDSLRNRISLEKDAKKLVRHFYHLGDALEDEPDSAIFYYNKARQTALAAGDEVGVARYASHVISMLNQQGKYREGLDLAAEALEIYKRLNIVEELPTAYLNVGNQWHYLSDFESATDNYIMAGRIADSLNDRRTQRTVANNLSSIFTELKQFEKAEGFALRALELAVQRKDTMAMLSPLYNLASINFEMKKLQKALEFINRFEQIAEKNNNAYDLSDAWLSKGRILGEINVAEGINWLNKSLELAKKEGFPQIEFYAYRYKAEVYLKNRQFQEAVASAESGIPIARQLEARYELSQFHNTASQGYEALGNYKQALAHRRIFEQLNEEIKLEENKNQILNLEARYRFDQKETEIENLNNQNLVQQLRIKQKNTLNWVLAAVVVGSLLLAYLLFKTYKNKQLIQQQRITELENEKQLFATNALLQGQEEERSRMARELHDGLGGLLSGVKLNLNQMKKKLIISEEDGIAFENSLELLDQSMGEMRRIAHNLMPESIIRMGLDGAIKEFLGAVNPEELRIVYQSYHIENGLGKQLDIATYRIVQELISNILKHARATEALVQIRKDEHALIIDVEDNGIGFQPDKKGRSGIGLAGLRSRIKYWKGTLDIQSEENKGSSFHIEIPL